MGNFNRGNRSGGRGFGNDRGRGSKFGGGRDRGPVEMHKVVCSDCGDNCEVPFRPTGDKPVFCSDCFKKQGGGNSRGSRDSGRGGFRPQQSNYKEDFEKLNKKLDKIINMILEDSRAIKKEADSAAVKTIVKKIMKKPAAKKVTKKVVKGKVSTKKLATKKKK